MKAKLAATFFPLLCVIVPLAGVLLTLLRYQEGEIREAKRMAAATVLGAFVYIIIFT